MNFAQVKSGKLGLTSRPGKKKLPHLHNWGVTLVGNLLSESEGGQNVQGSVEQLGIKCVWIPLRNGDIPPKADFEKVYVGVVELAEALLDGEVVMLHCSAGLHRTGMISNAILRY
eukprot:TRINITY_DN3617_c0_g1_i2.p1 TRINITY_DN3617_c0_g1~~TRINITY_DN3617_c0_g1_i2.p1  ORF type:complete len:123 (-),score=23.57 TRINITY_DN3617_c0_g1_i2:85-429(-)